MTAAGTRTELLDLQGIWAGYGETTVLRGVDLSVPAGSVVTLTDGMQVEIERATEKAVAKAPVHN